MKQFLSKEEADALIKKYQNQGDIKARNKLIMNYYLLVKSIASKVYNKYKVNAGHLIDIDDFVSAGIFGLTDALDKYDCGKNNISYIYTRIQGSMLDHARNLLKDRKNRVAKKIFCSLDALFEKEGGNKDYRQGLFDTCYTDYRYSPEVLYFKGDIYNILESFSKRHDFYNKDKDIFYCFFLRGMKIHQIAEKLNIKAAYISSRVYLLRKKIKKYYQYNYCQGGGKKMKIQSAGFSLNSSIKDGYAYYMQSKKDFILFLDMYKYTVKKENLNRYIEYKNKYVIYNKDITRYHSLFSIYGMMPCLKKAFKYYHYNKYIFISYKNNPIFQLDSDLLNSIYNKRIEDGKEKSFGYLRFALGGFRKYTDYIIENYCYFNLDIKPKELKYSYERI